MDSCADTYSHSSNNTPKTSVSTSKGPRTTGEKLARHNTTNVRRIGQTTGHIWTDVFLEKVIAMPDTVTKHLMESGDVETNPGPECGVCGSHQMRCPVECTQCRKPYCKTDCIGNRWKTEKNIREGKPIVCRICKGEPISKKGGIARVTNNVERGMKLPNTWYATVKNCKRQENGC